MGLPRPVVEGPGLTKDQRRSRRKHDVRHVTINVARLSKREIELQRALDKQAGPADAARPRTRDDCVGGARPCPFVSCKHHLYLDVRENGSIVLNFPDMAPDDMPETCTLDVADDGGATLEEIGAHMNLTRERVRQLENRALAKVRAALASNGARELLGDDDDRAPKRRLPIFEDDGDLDAFAFDVDRFAGDALDGD